MFKLIRYSIVGVLLLLTNAPTMAATTNSTGTPEAQPQIIVSDENVVAGAVGVFFRIFLKPTAIGNGGTIDYDIDRAERLSRTG